MLRILHTGDIHLDTPFSGIDSAQAQVRRNELRAAFTSMLHYVKCEKIDLLLIAGDLFDAHFVTRETLVLIKRELEALKCPVVISPGNHDSVGECAVWQKGVFSDNTYIFTKDTLEHFDFPSLNTRVWGWAFTSNTMDENPLGGHRATEDGGEGMINLLCAHGDLMPSRRPSCPLSVAELERFGADYAALGHIHNPREYTDRIAYCGCLEGRAFDELGVKGALLVEIDGERITRKKLRFSKRRYELDELDVFGASSNTELAEKIRNFIAAKRYGDDTLLRLTLKGEVSPAFSVNAAALESCSDRVFALKIIDETVPMLDVDRLRRDPTLRGELYRVLEGALSSTDASERERASAALRVGLAAIAGEDIP